MKVSRDKKNHIEFCKDGHCLKKGSQPNSCEKYWILALQCQSYVKQVKGVQFRCNYIEPNRIVIIKVDLMTPITRNFSSVIIISRSETNSNASVMRVCEQLYLDFQAGGISSVRQDDVAYAENVVLKNLHWK
ncbi:hypothetical protein PHMEG_00033190 [Phytophthora megakarya]|uniref:Uncharacterized protein n=1 Tax=Phytophthora megakarya TaxID=4795 RepID=A0A225UTW4_9STRA|nr:hypothetical protein PHMEG_00033190 [Phytophthora megakarya]